MRRLAVVIPELLSEAEPTLDRSLPAFAALASRSKLYRLRSPEPAETPEARLLGMNPTQAELHQGPLTVAALGADPPPRSLHFHVSLLSVDGGLIQSPAPGLIPEELRIIVEMAKRLNTRSLTFVPGAALDHGLVWENLGDMKTIPAAELLGQPIRSHLPQGDGESMMRQYIDDSVNMLSELEFNRRRLDEGFPPVNLLWPWGQGVRVPVPNLALLRGEPATVTSNSLRLAGLSRLVGYRHSEIGLLGKGLQTRARDAIGRMLGGSSSVLVLDAIEEFRMRGELDEAAYLSRQFDKDLVEPLLERAVDESLQFLLAAPAGVDGGLALVFNSKVSTSSTYPFDERSIDEPRVNRVDLESLVAAALSADAGEF